MSKRKMISPKIHNKIYQNSKATFFIRPLCLVINNKRLATKSGCVKYDIKELSWGKSHDPSRTRIMSLFWLDANNEWVSGPSTPFPFSQFVWPATIVSPPKSSDILFLAHYKVPAMATLPASAPASLTKVTFNHPYVTPELALTGSTGLTGETMFVPIFPMF